ATGYDGGTQGCSHDRPCDGGAAEDRAGCGLICLRKQLLQRTVAAGLLERELSKAARGEGQIRSRWVVLCASRRRQRRLECRRFYADGRAMTYKSSTYALLA